VSAGPTLRIVSLIYVDLESSLKCWLILLQRTFVFIYIIDVDGKYLSPVKSVN